MDEGMKMAKTPEELYKERTDRIEAAINLKVPDRVPIAPQLGFFPIRYNGMTCQQALDDYQRMAQAWKKTVLDFKWDMFSGPSVMYPGRVFDILGIKQFKLPGRQLPPDVTYQYVEGEYMEAEEYDEFFANPGEFTIKRLFPRMAVALDSFKDLPAFHSMASGYALVMGVPTLLAMPNFAEAIEALINSAKEAASWLTVVTELQEELKDLGFPVLFSSLPSQAPFDHISDFLRGMRGAMLDMYRNPDKLLRAIDLVTQPAIDGPLNVADMSGINRIFMPLHRGSKIFMSDKQFETFYWPSFKKVVNGLVNAGMIVAPFFEGDYTPRLEYLKELPKGKIVGHFDQTDLAKVKEVLGDRMCIKGNIPASLLCTGTPRQVEEYCKRLIDIVGEGGGYIMDGGSGIPDEAKPENVKAMTEFTMKYGEYKK